MDWAVGSSGPTTRTRAANWCSEFRHSVRDTCCVGRSGFRPFPGNCPSVMTPAPSELVNSHGMVAATGRSEPEFRRSPTVFWVRLVLSTSSAHRISRSPPNTWPRSRIFAGIRYKSVAKAPAVKPRLCTFVYATGTTYMQLWSLHNPCRYMFVAADGPTSKKEIAYLLAWRWFIPRATSGAWGLGR